MVPPKFTSEEIKDLARVLLKTQPVELTCEEWLAEIAPYAEAIIASSSLPPNAAAIEHHLDICPECKEEFDSLLAILRNS